MCSFPSRWSGSCRWCRATTGLTPVEIGLLEKASASIPIFRSGNMSLGINLVQQLLQSATKVLGGRFDIEIIENTTT
jgi:4-hydroxy-tetrahydrodipicolinate reductase